MNPPTCSAALRTSGSDACGNSFDCMSPRQNAGLQKVTSRVSFPVNASSFGRSPKSRSILSTSANPRGASSRGRAQTRPSGRRAPLSVPHYRPSSCEVREVHPRARCVQLQSTGGRVKHEGDEPRVIAIKVPELAAYVVNRSLASRRRPPGTGATEIESAAEILSERVS
jgi:hypothetical protein